MENVSLKKGLCAAIFLLPTVIKISLPSQDLLLKSLFIYNSNYVKNIQNYNIFITLNIIISNIILIFNNKLLNYILLILLNYTLLQ